MKEGKKMKKDTLISKIGLVERENDVGYTEVFLKTHVRDKIREFLEELKEKQSYNFLKQNCPCCNVDRKMVVEEIDKLSGVI